MGGWIDVWMDGLMYGGMMLDVGWMEGCVDRWIDAWMDRMVHGGWNSCMDRWNDACMS